MHRHSVSRNYRNPNKISNCSIGLGKHRLREAVARDKKVRIGVETEARPNRSRNAGKYQKAE